MAMKPAAELARMGVGAPHLKKPIAIAIGFGTPTSIDNLALTAEHRTRSVITGAVQGFKPVLTGSFPGMEVLAGMRAVIA